ncbi:Arc family DNA-binding protein [Delftia tsuruhatensis]
MASDDVQTNLRLPANLKERLVASAAESNRSLSAEVASRLEQSYAAREDSLTKTELREMFSEMAVQHETEIASQTVLRDLLATYVAMLYQALPPDPEKEARYGLAYELARDLTTDGNPKLEEILGKLFNSNAPGAMKSLSSMIRRDSEARRRNFKLKPKP